MAGTLTGTVAVVTGASSGIGEATARRLTADGATVAVLARRQDRLNSLVAAGEAALAVAVDITDTQQATFAIDRVVAELGRVDTLVNNAGLMLVGPVADAPPDEWDRMIDINVHGLLNITQATLPHLVKAAEQSPREVADLVNISSTAGRVARAGTAVYNLTKFGVNAFTEALRQELQPKRVRVSVVEPGTVDTELSSHIRDGVRESVQSQLAGMEMLRPEDIADAVSYIVTRDRRVAVNEVLIRASAQTW